jgi:PKD repeat protein
MWYSGHDSITQQWKIGYATSSDGISWTKYISNPVLDLGPGGSWDDGYVWSPAVIKDGATFKMWYNGNDGSAYRIGYATSPDGITWTKFGGNPVLNIGASGDWDDYLLRNPTVILDGGIYKLWYGGSDGARFRIGMATSPDGIVWTKSSSNPLLNIGPVGEFDDFELSHPVVIKDGSIFKMRYAGFNGANGRIGYATSLDGVLWNKYPLNPILNEGAPGAWDGYIVVPSSIFEEVSGFRMWYTGYDGSNYRLGLATENYVSLGYLESSIFDSGVENSVWTSINWTEYLPPMTNITFSTRTGDTPTPSASWSSWSAELWDETGSQILSPPGRYIQYRATLTTSDPMNTPILSDVTIQYFPSPIADMGEDIAVNEDEIFFFDGTGSTGAIQYYNWSFGDGTFNNGTEPMPSHSYSRSGVYKAILKVSDVVGNWDTDSSLVFVNNLPPIADAGTDMNVNEDENVNFNGSLSTDTPSDLPNLIYTWYFDDGSVGTGKTTNHTYVDSGIYSVTLVVTDDNGATSSDSITVTPITVNSDAGSDVTAEEDKNISFDGSGSLGTIQFYNWSFGDGTFDNGSNPNPIHAYQNEGVYTVLLNVTHVSGNWDIDSVLVFVNNVHPIADAGSDLIADEGQVVSFNGSLSTDTPSDMPNLVYTWYFGDGDVGSGMMATHTYSDNGIYSVTLLVEDDNGASSSDDLLVTVNNVAPTIQSIQSQTLIEGSLFNLQASASDPGNDILTFSDNTEMFDIEPSTGRILFTPGENDIGTSQITISVTDDDSASDTVQFNITVVALPVNTAPVLENPSATASGTFSVTYKDEDGDPPDRVMVMINGTVYEMSLESGDDFKTGVIFQVIINLDFGQHVYWFKAYDIHGGSFTSSLSTIEIPKPQEIEEFDWILPLLLILIVLAIIIILLQMIAMRRSKEPKLERETETIDEISDDHGIVEPPETESS